MSGAEAGSRANTGGGPDADGRVSGARAGIERATVEHIAALARIQLGPEELQRFGVQLQSILDYFRTLQQVDTTGVEPLVHAVETVNVLADDEPAPSVPREDALRGAADQDGRLFCVPKILGEEA